MNTVTHQKSFSERWLIMPKLLYFTLTVALYATNGVLGIFLKESWNVNNWQLGFVYSMQIVNFFGSMMWTSLADRGGRHRNIIILTCLVSASVYTGLALPMILKLKFTHWVMKFIFPAVMMTTMWFFQSALFPLIDSSVMIKLSSEPGFSKDQLGYQRLFGSVGHAVGTIMGAKAQSAATSKELFQAIVVGSCSIIFSIFVFFGLPAKLEGKKHAHHAPAAATTEKAGEGKGDVEMARAAPTGSPMVRCITDPTFFLFMLFVLSAGLLANTMTIFQPILSKEISQLSTFHASFLKIPSICSEIIVWLTSKYIMASLGKYWLLVFSQLAGLSRIFGYQFCRKDNVWLMYILESFKGMNSGFIVSAAIQISHELAPAGCGSTAQGLFSGVYKGIAIFLTGIVCGCILLFTDLIGLFMWIGFISTGTTSFFFCKFLFFDRTIGLPGFPSRPRHVVKA